MRMGTGRRTMCGCGSTPCGVEANPRFQARRYWMMPLLLRNSRQSSMALSVSALEKLPWPPPGTRSCPLGTPAASRAFFNSADWLGSTVRSLSPLTMNVGGRPGRMYVIGDISLARARAAALGSGQRMGCGPADEVAVASDPTVVGVSLGNGLSVAIHWWVKPELPCWV